MITLLRVIEGLALLTLGRRLFWLFVAAIGFEAGALIATRFFPQSSELVVLITAILLGIIGALFAIFMQGLIVGAVGFIAGGVIAIQLVNVLNIDLNWLPVVAFVIGGIIGATLIAMLFDWALMALSSLAGAITLTKIFIPTGSLALVAIIVLFIIGMAIQSGWMWSQRRRTV
jgi:hypothetical protein